MTSKEVHGLGKRIQRLRKDKRLTQDKLSEKIGISLNYLSNIETGRDACSFAVLLNIANALDASVDSLLGDSLRRNRNNPDTPGEAHTRLRYKINLLSEKDCEHLIQYVSLLEAYCENENES